MTIVKALGLIFPAVRTPPEIPRRALTYGPNISLSFVLLNEDSSQGSYVRSWDIENAIKRALRGLC
jgi:phosphatidylinositol glycan class S